MVVKTLDEGVIQEIGHAFGYYDYGTEKGLVSVFSGPDKAAEYICGYARGMLRGGFLHTTSERSRIPMERRAMTAWLMRSPHR